jgi:hypothetical protein
LDQPPQEELFAQDLRIILKVSGGGYGLGQGLQISHAADGFELVFIFEPLRQGDQVDRLALIVHLDQQFIKVLVAQIVKGVRPAFELLDTNPQIIVGR